MSDKTLVANINAAGRLKVTDLGSTLDLITSLNEALVDVTQEHVKGQKAYLDAWARVEGALNSGSAAARTKAWVDMQELILRAPTEYAKSAYAPDEKVQSAVDFAVNAAKGKGFSDEQLRKVAWETYYNNVQPNGQANIGTYQEFMVKNFGVTDPETGLRVEPTNITFDDRLTNERRQLVHRVNAVELDNARTQDILLRRLQAPAEAYKQWLNGAEDTEATRKAWYESSGQALIDQIPQGQVDGLIKTIKKRVETQGVDPTVKAEQDRLKEELAWAHGRLDGAGAEPEETDDDRMADWVAKPNVQAWAKDHGLNIGTQVEPTPELVEAIKAGKASGYTLTKWGTVYKKGPDDEAALKLAYKQLKQDPNERSIFRPKAWDVPVEITLKADTKPKTSPVMREGFSQDGERLVAQLADGTYVSAPLPVADEPPEWAVVSPNDEDIVKGAVMGPAQEAHSVTYTPPAAPRVVKGFLQKVHYADVAEGSLGKTLMTEDGKPIRIADEDIASMEYVGGSPPEPRAERAREKMYERKMKKTGLTGEEEQLGDKVDKKAEKERVANIAAVKPGMTVVPDKTTGENLQPLPSKDAFVQEHTQRARAGESLGANQDRFAADSAAGTKPVLAPGMQSQSGPALIKPAPKHPGSLGVDLERPPGKPELRQEALRDSRMAVEPTTPKTREEAWRSRRLWTPSVSPDAQERGTP